MSILFSTRHVSKVLHCPGFAFFSWLLQRDQAIARCCICNFEPHKKMRLMWHLLKMQSNASSSEESVALWITWMHRDNPPCQMQYIEDASQELHITKCKGPALLCNVFKMHHRKHGLRDACDWFPLQDCKAHPDVSVCRVVEGLSSG